MVARRRSTGLTKSWNIMTSIICYDLVFHLPVIKSRLKPLGSTRLLYLETLLIRFAITVRDLFKIQSSFLWETQTDSKYSRWGMGGESLALYIIYSGPLTALFGRTKFSLTNRFFTFPNVDSLGEIHSSNEFIGKHNNILFFWKLFLCIDKN